MAAVEKIKEKRKPDDFFGHRNRNSSTFAKQSLAVRRKGERCDRCLWQMTGAERVAAVEKIKEKRKPDDFFGHRNRNSSIKVATSVCTGGSNVPPACWI